MSMSTHVAGIRPPDERWQQMKAAWDACKAARIPVPSEVEMFFGGPPDPAGIVMALDSAYDGGVKIAREWSDDMREGLEIDIADIPSNITTIRFYNSW